MAVLAFDIYGTLIDPLSIESHFSGNLSKFSREISQLWRQKQLEYAMRRAVMQRYVSFPVCTEQALEYAARQFGVELSPGQKRELLDHYLRLPAYADVSAGLASLAQRGHTLIAFSNGTESDVRGLLENAKVLKYFEMIVSVDDVKTFKPSPVVYDYLAERCGGNKHLLWLVSSNPFDVIGAKSAGLRAAWLRRNPSLPFDPWEFSPDVAVQSLEELAGLELN